MNAPLRSAMLATLLAGGCAPASGGDVRVPEYHPEGQTKAHVAKSSSRPLIVEWPASDRAALEAQRARGIVVVRYGQGEMELLPLCHAAATYRFTRLTPKAEGLVIRDGEELHAALPIHSATLEGRLAKRQALEINMTVVGVYDSEPRTWRAPDLRGDCARATHVVAALTVGAFDIVARASERSAVSASVLGASAGRARDAHREIVNRDGLHEACAREAAGGAAPDGCGALLRVDLQPIQVPVERSSCAPDDVACMQARARGGCGPGFVRKGEVCEAVDPERPSLVEGLGGTPSGQ